MGERRKRDSDKRDDPVKLEERRQQNRDCNKRRKTDPVKLEKIRQQMRDCNKRTLSEKKIAREEQYKIFYEKREKRLEQAGERNRRECVSYPNRSTSFGRTSQVFLQKTKR